MRRTKRALAWVLALAISLTSTSVTALAADVASGTVADASTTVEVTTPDSGVVETPGEGESTQAPGSVETPAPDGGESKPGDVETLPGDSETLPDSGETLPEQPTDPVAPPEGNGPEAAPAPEAPAGTEEKKANWELVNELIEALPTAETVEAYKPQLALAPEEEGYQAAYDEEVAAYRAGVQQQLTEAQAAYDALNKDEQELVTADNLAKLTALSALLGAVTLEAKASGVATVDGTSYDTLQAAINDADGKTVQVISEVSDFGTLTVDKAITLNLNGQTIVGREVNVTGTGAKLTIVDSTETVAPAVDKDYNVTYTSGKLQVEKNVNAMEGATVELQRGTVVSTGNIALRAVGDLSGAAEIKSTVTMTGGYAKSQESTLVAVGKGAAVNFNGGVAESIDNAVIAGNGSNGAGNMQGGTTIDITGGTLIGRIKSTGYVSCGVYHPQEGTLTISGGIIYSEKGCGVLMRGGRLDMTGGEIIAKGDANLTGKVGDARVVVPTSGIVFDREAGYYDAANVNISVSGEKTSVTGTKSAVEVVGTAAQGQIALTGGKYSSNVGAFVPEGYAYDSTTGVVSKKNAVASIGDIDYNTIAQAVEAVKVSGAPATIKLNKSIEENVAIPENVTVTLEIPTGVELSNNGAAHTIENKGTLTVTGAGTVKNTVGGRAVVANYPGATANLNGGTITGDSWYVIKNLGTMTMDGVTVTQGDAKSSSIANGYYGNAGNDLGETSNASGKNVNLTITSGTFSGGMNTVKNDDYGVLVIETGKFSNTDGPAVLNWNEATIKGGTYSVNKMSASVFANGYLDDTADKGIFVITGGTFTAADNGKGSLLAFGIGTKKGGSFTITGGEFNGVFNYTDKHPAKPVITGGKFHNDSVKDFVPAGYAYNEDTKTVGKAAASIGTTYYATIDKAVAAAKEGETILVHSGTYDTAINLTGVPNSVTLKADGKVTLKGGITGSSSIANLTIDGFDFESQPINGTWYSPKGETTITVKNNTFTNAAILVNNPVVADQERNVIISGNTFTGGAGPMVSVENGNNVVVANNTMKNATGTALKLNNKAGKVSITGNTFENWAADGNTAAGRAMDLNGDNTVVWSIVNNKMVRAKGQESFVKITGLAANSKIDITKNYWNGFDPSSEKLADGTTLLLEADQTVNVYPYYADLGMNKLVYKEVEVDKMGEEVAKIIKIVEDAAKAANVTDFVLKDMTSVQKDAVLANADAKAAVLAAQDALLKLDPVKLANYLSKNAEANKAVANLKALYEDAVKVAEQVKVETTVKTEEKTAEKVEEVANNLPAGVPEEVKKEVVEKVETVVKETVDAVKTEITSEKNQAAQKEPTGLKEALNVALEEDSVLVIKPVLKDVEVNVAVNLPDSTTPGSQVTAAAVPTTLVFEIKPFVQTAKFDNSGNVTDTVGHEEPISNAQLSGAPITFRLAIPSAITDKYVNVRHESEGHTTTNTRYTIQSETNTATGKVERYVDITVSHFSTFTLQFTNVKPSTGGGSVDRDSIWPDVKTEIIEAKDGAVIKADARYESYVPTSVLELLRGKDVTLVVAYGDGNITINGQNMLSIPSSKIWYTFEQLAELYKNIDPTEKTAVGEEPKQNPVTGGIWEVPEATVTVAAAPVAAKVQQKAIDSATHSAQSAPVAPAADAAQTPAKTSTNNGLVIAAAGIALVTLAGTVLLGRKKRV